ncbi:MAG: HEAT repeat domain-containing protein, partial [Planctomycetota bacterium]|nr:HEAT repeat domain-containing protein [Planctomycetota bacterium]
AAAATALADAGDQDSQDPIKELLKPERPVATRCAAVNALGKLNAQGLALILSRTIHDDPAVEVRLAALEAMPDSVGPDVMVYLIELSVKGEPPPVAAAAARKLGQLRTQKSLLSLYGGGETAIAGQAVSRLMDATKAYNQMVEDAESQLNPDVHAPRKPQPYEVAAKKLSSADRAERMQAAFDLGVLADGRAEAALVAGLQDPDADIALTAADALSKLPAVKAPEKIAALLRNAAPGVRRAAARAYGKARVSSMGVSPMSSSFSADASPPSSVGATYAYPHELPIEKRHGAHLPHWTKVGATYSVTFRLADSVPSQVLEGRSARSATGAPADRWLRRSLTPRTRSSKRRLPERCRRSPARPSAPTPPSGARR